MVRVQVGSRVEIVKNMGRVTGQPVFSSSKKNRVWVKYFSSWVKKFWPVLPYLDLFNTSKYRFIGLFYFFYLDVGFGFYVGFGVMGSTCLEILSTGKWPLFFPNIKGLPQNRFGGNFFQPITWWLKKPRALLGYVWLNRKYFSIAKYFLGENNFSKIKYFQLFYCISKNAMETIFSTTFSIFSSSKHIHI